MAGPASSELTSLRRFARRYFLYGTLVLAALLVGTEVGAPKLIEWYRMSGRDWLWLELSLATYALVLGLWTRLHLWALLVPVVLKLFQRVDVRDRLKRGVWWALVIGVPVALVHVIVERGIFAAADFVRRGVYPSFTTSFDLRTVDPYGLEGRRLVVFLFRRFLADYFTYFIIAAVCFAYEHFVRFREQEAQAQALRAELSEAQLQALRMQVNPHFLFNTLNAIAVLVRGGETKKAGRTLRLLSDLLRATFKGADVQMVPLQEELDLVERYLEIEQVRFGERLQVEIDAEPAASEVPVPYLLLQPLVENAVRHGIGPHAEAGVVRVSADLVPGPDADQVELTVADSGPGFPADDPDAVTEDDGVGLSNTMRRLETLYGERHAFELGTAAEGGARITIRIPMDPDATAFDVEEPDTAVPTPE